jgi:DNA adenine methylase
MSFFRYPGGKAKFQDKIEHKIVERTKREGLQYREPFFGGGGIGLKFLENNPSVKSVWINDRDIGIASLWSSVLAYPTMLKAYVRAFEPTPAKFYEFKEELLGLDTMPFTIVDVIAIGFKKLAIHQLSFSGLGTKAGGPLGGKSQESKYKIDCRWSPDYLCKKIDRFHHLFSKLTIQYGFCTSLDFELMIQDESKKALLYLDPPYFNKGNELYQYGFKNEDHERLAYLLERTPHDWVLSYDDCPEIRKLYKWATVEQIEANYTIRSARVKSELIIYPQ